MTTRAYHPDGARAVDFSALVGRLADEMTAGWRAGDEPLAEVYFDRHPDLRLHADAALELIAEELALREECGRPTSPSELTRRFPHWRSQVETLWHCQHAFPPGADTPRPPAAGDELGGFRLVAELGRGANGRVFLATQSALGGRPAVLKLVPGAGGEHLSLARLQHTHIVPLYSAHEFPDRGLRALCMPYFGRATLATLSGSIVGKPARTAGLLLTALREAEKQSPRPLPVVGPACELFEHLPYNEVVCRIGADLADALEYAHERGLVHLDIKPSNVLIGADGVPMLLDFHLARPPLRAGSAPPPWLGGTPEYMAPELAAAVEAVRAGADVPGTVDGRADIYSLGLLLREALDAPQRTPCSRVPAGLCDILARCTAPDPADRYPSAAALASDLRRHLADLPLKGVPNRSVTERWGKWRRRRPFVLPAALLTAAMVLAGAGFGFHIYRQAERAAVALQEGEAHFQHGRYAESLEAFRCGEALLCGVPFSDSLADRLRNARRTAERAQTAAELHRFCEQVRPLYGTDASADVRAAADRCRTFWAEREQIVSRLEGQPTAELDRQWRADLLDLGILTAHLRAKSATPGNETPAHRLALTILDEAETLLGPSGVLCLERAVHAKAIGLQSLADGATRQAAALAPRTAWEHLVVGRAILASGDLRGAATAFERCLELDPGSLWGNHFRGVCLLRSGDAAGAASAFSACVALSRQSPWFHYNRGLAHAESGRLDWARADFDRALALDSRFAAAFVGRALVHHHAGRATEALADLRTALDAGFAPATLHYHTAVVRLANGDRPGAVAALRECLALDPAHREAQDALTHLLNAP